MFLNVGVFFVFLSGIFWGFKLRRGILVKILGISCVLRCVAGF